MALFYDHLQWYEKEATAKEKKGQRCLNWLNQTPIAHFLLWLCSNVAGVLFFCLPLFLSFVTGEPQPDDDGDIDIPEAYVSNAILMTASKLSFLLALCLLLVYMFAGNYSLYFQIFANKFTQSIRKLLFGAFLVSPIFAKGVLALKSSPPIDLTFSSGFQLYILNVVGSFVISFALYLTIECPVGDFLRLLISDVVKLIHRGVDK